MMENTTTEFKREFNQKVINTMLAFLNTEGGTLYLGLSDDGSNTVMATREHIRQMSKDNGAGQFVAELSIEQDLTFEYADGVFSDRGVKFGQRQKQSLGLVRPDGRQ